MNIIKNNKKQMHIRNANLTIDVKIKNKFIFELIIRIAKHECPHL